MDYFAIGERIRRFRRAQSLSQEQLAEQAGISVTHMSHIETGNTKLSLPTLVALSEALSVSTDDLIFGTIPEHTMMTRELVQLLEQCSAQERRIVAEVARATLLAVRKYPPEEGVSSDSNQ